MREPTHKAHHAFTFPSELYQENLLRNRSTRANILSSHRVMTQSFPRHHARLTFPNHRESRMCMYMPQTTLSATTA